MNALLPFLYNENEIISVTNVSDSSKSGAGDLTLGLFYTLKSESSLSPSITALINITAPTGSTADPADLNGLSTGAGFWGIGFDFDSGYGLIDAEAAIGLSQDYPASTPPEPSIGDSDKIIVNDSSQVGGGGMLDLCSLLMLFIVMLTARREMTFTY